MISKRLSVAGVLPTVARYPEGSAHASCRKHYGSGPEHSKAATLAVIGQRACDAVAVFEQRDYGAFHVDLDALMNAVILEGANQFQPRAVAHVRESRIAMSSEVSLKYATVRGAIKDRAPGFKLAHSVGRFSGVKLGHAPVVDVLASAHRVGEMNSPVIALIYIGQRRRDSSLGHHRVRFSEKRFANQPDGDSRR